MADDQKTAEVAAQRAEREAQEIADKEQEQGFAGAKVDPTPNENYTVDGVTSGKPTPETDDKARAKAQEAGRTVAGDTAAR